MDFRKPIESKSLRYLWSQTKGSGGSRLAIGSYGETAASEKQKQACFLIGSLQLQGRPSGQQQGPGKGWPRLGLASKSQPWKKQVATGSLPASVCLGLFVLAHSPQHLGRQTDGCCLLTF